MDIDMTVFSYAVEYVKIAYFVRFTKLLFFRQDHKHVAKSALHPRLTTGWYMKRSSKSQAPSQSKK